MFNKILAKLFLLLVVPCIIFAQVPDHFTNLTVLPKTISKDDLLKVMRNFTDGLGVRCDFCHVEEKDQSTRKFDFSSDDKDNKKIARVMLKMVNNINGDYLSQIKNYP